MEILYFIIFLSVMTVLIFFSHMLKSRSYSGAFMMVISALWFFSYLSGQLNYKMQLCAPWGTIDVRFSSSLYLLVFACVLLVYICEGIHATQNIIVLSITFYLFMGMGQFFFGNIFIPLLAKNGQGDYFKAAHIFFEPSYWRMAVSILAVIVDAFFAILLFQFLNNRLKRLPLGVIIFLSLSLTMALDSLLFVAGTRLETFWATFTSHLVFKTGISFVVSTPFALYLKWFARKAQINLERGTFDIFKRIESLESELRSYAETLEEKVKLRTAELRLANEELQEYIEQLNEAKRIAEQDMRMAANVQEHLLPGGYEDKQNWDIAIEFKPMMQVSGDFYDFYEKEGRLEGVGLFDVSGHGVSSGLITVLAKAIVKRVFNTGRHLKFHRIIELINDNLIREIKSTGNYLTGILLRFDGDYVEYVNAGHGDLIYKNGRTGETICVTSGDNLWKGFFLGIEAMRSRFKTLKLKMSPGDVLVLYTDCLNESMNEHEEAFDIERIIESVQNCEEGSAESIKERILTDFYSFVGTSSLEDDLTLMVLKKF